MTNPATYDATSDFDDRPDAIEANRAAQAAGHQLEETKYVDYFAEPETHRFFLPDGQQYFDYQELREGGKALYEKATNQDIRVQRSTGDARLKVDPATQRQTMIRLSVVDACIFHRENGRMVRMDFNKERPGRFWDMIFDKFPAKLLEELHREMEKVNTWVAADDDVKALKEQRELLDERIARAEEEEAKKLSS